MRDMFEKAFKIVYFNRYDISWPSVSYSVKFFSYEDSKKTQKKAALILDQ